MIDYQTNKIADRRVVQDCTNLENDLFDKPNVNFYLQNIRITKQSLSIRDIHLRQKDYNWLEECHNYIQWMFPTEQQSQHNSNSFPLSQKQVEIFRTNKEIGYKIIKSFQIYCGFIGIKVNTRQKEFVIESQERAIQALAMYTHNHIRIKRILNCLFSIGLKPVMFWFVQMLCVLVDNCKVLNRNKQVVNFLEKQWKQYSFQRISKKLPLKIFHQTEKLNSIFQDFHSFQIKHQHQQKISTNQQNNNTKLINNNKQTISKNDSNLIASEFGIQLPNDTLLFKKLKNKIVNTSQNFNNLNTQIVSSEQEELKQQPINKHQGQTIHDYFQNEISSDSKEYLQTKIARIRLACSYQSITTYQFQQNNLATKQPAKSVKNKLEKTNTFPQKIISKQPSKSKPQKSIFNNLFQCFRKKQKR